MATVHPSRMSLVPMDPIGRNGSSSYDRIDGSGHFQSHDKVNYDDRSNDRRRARDTERRNESHRNEYDEPYARSKEYSKERAMSRERGSSHNNHNHVSDIGRRSPEYEDYRQSPSLREHNGQPPWRAKESMYPQRNGGRGRNNGLGGGSDFFEARRQQRNNMSFSIWPPSPKEPSRELLHLGDSKSLKHTKRRRSPSVSSTDSLEEERKRRQERKRREPKEIEDKESRHKRRHKSYHTDKSGDESESRGQRSQRRRSRHRSPTSPSPGTEDDQWQEKLKDEFTSIAQPAPFPVNDSAFTGKNNTTKFTEDDDDIEVGPMPAPKVAATNKKIDERAYGGALLRGEGSAMAAFLQEGGTEARIPRRGEIGLTSEEIASYESVGYVMSGSRHRRMNAVRMRKENQVISAEEKRGILKLQREERERRETILQDEFRELVEEKLKGANGKLTDVADLEKS